MSKKNVIRTLNFTSSYEVIVIHFFKVTFSLYFSDSKVEFISLEKLFRVQAIIFQYQILTATVKGNEI